ncbi:helix-turn-helix domain-containing protein [Lentzea sp. NPDC051213]|uniref:helix-turn-helix domain-containing protein n=1 Tax=Lentzea sp. NPDC051213 TaxID=3364126 RepID=UPI0037A7C1C0
MREIVMRETSTEQQDLVETPPDTPPLLYTPAEAAVLLAVKESWLRRQAGQRRVPCTHLGKHLRFSDADLRVIVESAQRSVRTRSRPPRRR